MTNEKCQRQMTILSHAAPDVRRTSGASLREFFRRTYVLAASESACTTRRLAPRPERPLRLLPESSSALPLNLEHSRWNSRGQDLRAAPSSSDRAATKR